MSTPHTNTLFFLASAAGPDEGQGFDWNHDLNERLAWLYGDAEERRLTRAPDLLAWKRLGRKVAGRAA